MSLATRAVAVLALAGAIGIAGWYVSSLRAEISRLERDLASQQALRATENATRERQARRAIETARRQEAETRSKYDAIDAQMQTERARAAADHAAAELRRVRDIAAARAATAARGGRLPEAAPAAGGGEPADPIGFLLAVRSADEADARLADELAAELAACYARARADRALR